MKQDMRDDWFSDSLKYEDLYSAPNDLIETIKLNLELGHGQYNGSEKKIYDVPKIAHGLRYSLETDFYDRFLFQSITSYLIPFYDPLLSNRVLSHRFNKYRNKEKYLFKNRIDLWQTFEGITSLGLDQGQTLLVTDLINYFEHISINSVEKSFMDLLPKVKATGAEKNKIRSAIYTLITLLKKWCFNDLHGLPQNRDASSFIANVVLVAVDRKMVELGYDYYRYVDDIRIICTDKLKARQALNALIAELRKLGMNINSKKTDILSSESSDEVLKSYFPGYDDRSLAIDNMWKSKNKKVIARSIPLLHELLTELVEKNETQSRQFRFCINRFKSLISANIFDSKSIVARELADTIIDHLEDQPASTDQFCKLLNGFDLENNDFSKIENFLLDRARSIFNWQNFHLWLFLAQKEYKTTALIKEALRVIKEDTFASEIPSCFIYLASVGESQEVELLIPQFNVEWPYQHQRFFLIALQNTSPATLQPLISKIHHNLRGTIKRLKSNKEVSGLFVQDYENSSFEDIYDELSPYE